MANDIENWDLVRDGTPKDERYIGHDFIFWVAVFDGYMEPSGCCFLCKDDKVPDSFGSQMSI